MLDIPLLYETGGDRRVDAVAVVDNRPPDIQRERILARPNMTPDKLARSSGAADARRRKTPPGRFSGGHIIWPRFGAAANS